MAQQLGLFGPSLNVKARLKSAMREALKTCDLSRQQIVDRMNRLAANEGIAGGRGSKISPANLDAWVSKEKQNLIPVHLLTIFCVAVNDSRPIEILAAPCPEYQRKMKLLAWAECEIQAKRVAKRRRQILSEIDEFSD